MTVLLPGRRIPKIFRYAESVLPTEMGKFSVVVFRAHGTRLHQDQLSCEHLAIYQGDLRGKEGVFTRLHSECFTGEVLGSLLCDCAEQLHDALEHIAAAGEGTVVYLRQEGRGIGLGNKIRAYRLQHDQELDTIAANEALGFAADLRSFGLGATILRELGVVSVRLHTNNPAKIRALEHAGLPVVQRVPSRPTVHRHNHRYLRTKHSHMGHLLPFI